MCHMQISMDLLCIFVVLCTKLPDVPCLLVPGCRWLCLACLGLARASSWTILGAKSPPYGPKMAPIWAEMGQDGLKMIPRWPRDGHDGPSWPQAGQDGPKCGPRGPQAGPRSPQYGPKMVPRYRNMAPKLPKLTPTWTPGAANMLRGRWNSVSF
jgi:hypothetical protein